MHFRIFPSFLPSSLSLFYFFSSLSIILLLHTSSSITLHSPLLFPPSSPFPPSLTHTHRCSPQAVCGTRVALHAVRFVTLGATESWREITFSSTAVCRSARSVYTRSGSSISIQCDSCGISIAPVCM